MTNNDTKELTNFLDKYGVKYKVAGYRIVASEVDLTNRGITQLPDSIYYLQCDCLHLNNNNLTSLPNSIWNLKCKRVYLHDNNLTQLPYHFGSLNCEYLSLNNNNLTSLPVNIGDLQCEYLYLYDNSLTSLPNSFVNLKCKDLYLDYNPLTSDSIELLEKMKSDGVDVKYQPIKQTNIGCKIMINCANMVDPDHYKKGAFQTIDVIEEFLENESRLLTAKQKYSIGNALKYISRAGLKGSTPEEAITDLKKAENYIHRAITGEWIEAG